jgi:TatD DNase family protein
MFIDTHAHLDFPEFGGDVAATIGRANEVGVGKIINIGVDVESSKKSVDLARVYPEIFSTIGIHPHSSEDLNLDTRMVLSKFIANRKVVAIGEIGLDYYYLKRSSQFANYPDREMQIFCFEQMLDMALEFHLPIVIHAREAESDIFSVLKSYSNQLRGVFHCFSEDYEFAKKVLDLGFLISFTANITYKKSESTRVAIDKIPLGSIMLETDSPYLPPELKRGERNEPANVILVAEKIAEIKNISLEEVERTTTKKAESFFKLK